MGNIDSSGTITIEGNQSAGIRIDAPLTGNLSTSGSTSLVGDNSHGVLANAVAGNVTIRGTTAATGANRTDLALRPEGRRVGKEGASTCRSRGWPVHKKKNK